MVKNIDAAAAEDVVAGIESRGGRAAVGVAAIGCAEAAEDCVAWAVEIFRRLDAMCCNASLLRDRTLRT